MAKNKEKEKNRKKKFKDKKFCKKETFEILNFDNFE